MTRAAVPLVPLVAILAAASLADAAMLCARPRADGTLNASVKVRERCTPREVELGLLSTMPLRVVGPPLPTTTTTTTLPPGTCDATGAACAADTDCDVAGVCDNLADTATCVQTCNPGACNPGMVCFPSGQLGVGICAGCQGNDAECTGDAVCHDHQGGIGDNCAIHGFGPCVGQPTLTACTIPGRCIR